MAEKDLTLENFINGDVFLLGIDSTIFTESNPGEGPNKETSFPTNSFIILFDSSRQKMLATTKKLIKSPSDNISIGDIYFRKSNVNNGGELVINKIDYARTKNLISEDDGNIYTADGFAIIRAFSDAEAFPDFNKDYIILIKSKLENKPVFNKGTNFVFNDSVITFGAKNDG